MWQRVRGPRVRPAVVLLLADVSVVSDALGTEGSVLVVRRCAGLHMVVRRDESECVV